MLFNHFIFWNYLPYLLNNIILKRQVGKEIVDKENSIIVNPDDPASTDSNLLIASLKATCGNIENSRNEINANGLNNVLVSSFIAKGNIVGNPSADDSVLQAFTLDPVVGDLFESKHSFTTFIFAKGDINDFSTTQLSRIEEPFNSLVYASDVNLKTVVKAKGYIENFSNSQLGSITIDALPNEISSADYKQTFILNAHKDIIGSFNSNNEIVAFSFFFDITNSIQEIHSSVSAQRNIIFDVSGTWLNRGSSGASAEQGAILSTEQNTYTETLAGRNIVVENNSDVATFTTLETISNSAFNNGMGTIGVSDQQTSQVLTDVGKNLIIASTSSTMDPNIGMENSAQFINRADLIFLTSAPIDVVDNSQATLDVGRNILVKSNTIEEASASSKAAILNISFQNLLESGAGTGGTREINQTSVATLTANKQIKVISNNMAHANDNLMATSDITNTALNFALLESLNIDITGMQSTTAVLKTGKHITVSTAGNDVIASINNKADSFIDHNTEPLSVNTEQTSTAILKAKHGNITAEGENTSIFNQADATSMIAQTAASGTQLITAIIKAGGNINAYNTPDGSELPIISNGIFAEFLSPSGGQSSHDMSALISAGGKINGVLFEQDGERATTIRNQIRAENSGEGDSAISSIITARGDITGASHIISISGDNYEVEALFKSKFGQVTDSFVSVTVEGSYNTIISDGDTDDTFIINNTSNTVFTDNRLQACGGNDRMILQATNLNSAIEATTFVFEFGSGQDFIEGYTDEADNILLIDQKYADNGFVINEEYIFEFEGNTQVILSVDHKGDPIDSILIQGVVPEDIVDDIQFFV